jgi:ABC-type spermidine/putrescine transport system permease subunit II
MRLPTRIADAVAAVLGRLLVAVVVVIVLAPIVLTVVLSFSADASIRFPPTSWGFDNYVTLATSAVWLESLWLSVRLAVVAALIAFLVSLGALYAITRSRMPLRSWLEQGSILSILIPITAFAVALYTVFVQFGMLGSFWGMAIAHATLAIPFVMIIGGIAFRAQPIELELVAITLGASRFRAWAGITLRLAAPSLFGGFIMAFLASFEEAVLISFLGGPELLTLPKRILDALQWGSEPVVTAIATVIVVVISVALALPMALSRGKESR